MGLAYTFNLLGRVACEDETYDVGMQCLPAYEQVLMEEMHQFGSKDKDSGWVTI